MNDNTIEKVNKITKYDCLNFFICIFSIFLAQITENTDNNLFMYIGYTIAVVWTFFCKIDDILLLIVFLLSDNSLLDIGGISIQLIMMCIFLIRHAILKNEKIYFKSFFIGCIFFVYSLIYFKSGIGNMLQGLKLCVMIIFYTEFLRRKNYICLDRYSKILLYGVSGITLSLVIAVVLNPSMLLSSRIALSAESNWNVLGILSATLFCHSFFLYFIQPRKKYILFSLLLLIITFITTSRTAFVIIFIGLIWTLLTNQRKKGNDLKKIIIIIAILIFILLVYFDVVNIVFIENLIDRIVNPRQGDISNGRFELWLNYINYLKDNTKILIFGAGTPLIEGITSTSNHNITSLVAHNMIIEQVVMNGIIGSFIVMLLYLSSIKIIFKNALLNKKYSKKYFLTIFIIFVAGMVSHIITSVTVTTELYLGIIAFIALNNLNKKI